MSDGNGGAAQWGQVFTARRGGTVKCNGKYLLQEMGRYKSTVSDFVNGAGQQLHSVDGFTDLPCRYRHCLPVYKLGLALTFSTFFVKFLHKKQQQNR